MLAEWDNSIVDEIRGTDCDLLSVGSVDMELHSLLSLFVENQDDLPSPRITSKKKMGGRLEKQFRTPKFGK